MGLDHALRRRNEPKDILERTIKALDFTNDEDEDFEELFCWRKDYKLHDFFEKIENCEERKLSKQDLIIFLNFLKDHNGENDEYFKDDKLNYDKEIEVLSSIIKNYDNEDWVYYYWAWW